MVTDIGVAAKSYGKWEYLDTSGDPYKEATKEQQEYGSRCLLPFSTGSNVKLVWSMIPSKAAVLVSFIRCIPCTVSYNETMSVSMLPGDRSLLSDGTRVVGYNDLFGRVLYIAKGAVTHEFPGGWRYVLAKLWTAQYLAEGGTSRASEDLWVNILTNLMKGFELAELSEDLQSKLQWELRVRAGA